MHPTTDRLLFASLGIAGLGLAALGAVQSGAQPTTPPVQLQKWILSVPNRAMAPCPLTAAAGTPDVPYFGFAPGITMQPAGSMAPTCGGATNGTSSACRG